MHTYQVFGHLLLSDIQFPELVPSEGKPDIFLRRTKIDEPWEKCDNEIYIFKRIPTGILLTWPKYGRFLIRENFEIDVEFAQNDEDQITRFFFLGPVLGLVFHQKNYKIFHASAVALPQGAVAFLGKKGHGKSTLAAAFALQGNPLITDDVLVLKTEGKKVLAYLVSHLLSYGPNLWKLSGRIPINTQDLIRGLINESLNFRINIYRHR